MPGKHPAQTADQSVQTGEKVDGKKIKQGGRLFDSSESCVLLFAFVT